MLDPIQNHALYALLDLEHRLQLVCVLSLTNPLWNSDVISFVYNPGPSSYFCNPAYSCVFKIIITAQTQGPSYTKFWNSDRNHNALQESFSSVARQTPHSLTWQADMLTFVTNHALEWLVGTYFDWKLSKTPASLSNSMQFWGYWRFMQTRQRIFNCNDMQLMHFTLDKILKFLTYYTPLYY